MIIKVIERKSGQKSGFERLGRYILKADGDRSALYLRQKAPDAEGFKRAAEYVIDARGEGEKLAWSRITNCQSQMPALAIAEVLATQAANTRAKSDKTYHLVVSLAEGERLTPKQAAEVEDAISEGLGFGEHQRISAVHVDTKHWHLHIAINKIHPSTGKMHEPWRSYLTVDRLAKELELKHELVQANRIGDGRALGRAADFEAYQGEGSFLTYLRENAGGQVKDAVERARSWQDMHEFLARFGAAIKPRGAGLSIATIDGKCGVKASSLDRALSFKSLTDRLGDYEAARQREPLLLSQKREEIAEKKYEISGKPEGGGKREAYERVREERAEQKRAAVAELRLRQSKERNAVRERYRERRESVARNQEMQRRTKASAYRELYSEERKILFELKERQGQERRALPGELTWQEYLVGLAKARDMEALSLLREGAPVGNRGSGLRIRAADDERGKDHVYTIRKPEILRDGTVVYRFRDGGVVNDEAKSVSVQQVTKESVSYAAGLAGMRFEGKALVVEGTEEFKKEIAAEAGRQREAVRFVDVRLEEIRQREARAREIGDEEFKRAYREQQEKEASAQRKWEQEKEIERQREEDARLRLKQVEALARALVDEEFKRAQAREAEKEELERKLKLPSWQKQLEKERQDREARERFRRLTPEERERELQHLDEEQRNKLKMEMERGGRSIER